MELTITQDTTLSGLKQQFSRQFPHLKLEFFRTGHQVEQGSSPSEQLNNEVRIGSLLHLRKEGCFTFDPTMSVGDFEQRMQDEFGLPVQVFRRSNNLWLETVQTDHWSLAKQEKEGNASGKDYRSYMYN